MSSAYRRGNPGFLGTWRLSKISMSGLFGAGSSKSELARSTVISGCPRNISKFTHLTYSSSSFSIYPTGSQYVTGYDYHTSCLPMNPITKVIISPHPHYDVPSSSKDAVLFFGSHCFPYSNTPITQVIYCTKWNKMKYAGMRQNSWHLKMHAGTS